MNNSPVVIVTGGAKGIGLAYVTGLAERGYRIAVADLDEPPTDAQAVQSQGTEIIFIPTDISDENSTRQMAEIVLERFKRIDVLINNAALLHPDP